LRRRPNAFEQLLQLVLDELPSWIRNVRYERTDWLSVALQALWPHLERGISRELQWQLEPALRALAPGFVRRVRIEELLLGSMAPRVTGALCGESDGDSVELEFEVRWECDGRATLGFDLRAGRQLTFGVHDLSVSGMVRVRLAPLCSRPPGFAALSVCFAAPPTLQYRLSGVGAVADAIPGFAAYLKRCVGDAVSAAAVWPRSLVFALPASVVGGDPSAVEDELAPAAAGVLRVVVYEAAELSPAELLGLRDVSLPGGGKLSVSTSPYVTLELPSPPAGGRAGAQQDATAHKRNDLNPRFDETFTFVVDDPATQRLRIVVRAWDASGMTASSHSVMGETVVPLSGLRPGVMEDSYWALSAVVPKSITVQGVMATYRVPSFGGELEEVHAGRLRLGLLFTPFRGSPGALDDEDDEDDDTLEEDEDEEEEDESDGSSSGAEESEEATLRRDARRAARRRARRAARRHANSDNARRGVLFVRVEKGTDLRRVMGSLRQPDAYVTVALAGERVRELRKTRVVASSRSPAWHDEFSLFVDDAQRAELVCSVFDFSGVEDHIPLGEVHLPVLDIIAEQGGAGSFRETYMLLGSQQGGSLELWMQWRPY
jgi:Ca2+-dependent lipid-binding protein